MTIDGCFVYYYENEIRPVVYYDREKSVVVVVIVVIVFNLPVPTTIGGCY